MNETIDLVKELVFAAPKTRPTLNTTSSSSSTSSSSCCLSPSQPSNSSSSSYKYLSSSSSSSSSAGGGLLSIMTSTHDDDDDDEHNNTRSIGSTVTADDSASSDVVVAASSVKNTDKDPHHQEDHRTNETTTTTITAPLSSSPSSLPPAIPLRPNSKSAVAARNRNNTKNNVGRPSSDDAISSSTITSGRDDSTCINEDQQHRQQQDESSNQHLNNNNNGQSLQAGGPYRRHKSTSSSSSLPDRKTETMFLNRAMMMSSTNTTTTASSYYSSNNKHGISFGSNNEHANNDHANNDRDDDILGQLMSHPVTANWMLQQNHDQQHRNNGTATEATAGAGAAGWPMICVVGDTSSGKSSLLCQLSGIELPTNHQLTTRCPILLHIARKRQRPDIAEDTNDTQIITKMATIHIQWRSKLHNTNQHQKWKERICTDPNWQEIPSTILEAQEFILQQTGKQVAPDIVRVDVVYYYTDNEDDNDKEEKKSEENGEQTTMQQRTQAQPQHEYPYLTLLDLPGLVQTAAADESPTLVHEIQFLVRSYIQSPQTLILAVLSCTTDFHNAQVLAEILHGNNNSNNNNTNLAARTIPVLTKPDLMDAGAPEAKLRDDLLLGGKQLLPRVGAATAGSTAATTSTTTTTAPTTIQSSWSDDLLAPAASNMNKNSTNSNPFTFHMVKGRSQAALDRGDSIEEGLRDEAHFFETREPWKSVSNRTLFGTRPLQAKLAQLQHDVVRQTTLPRLHRDIHERRLALQMELQELIGGSCNNNNNNTIEVDAESGMPLAVMLETPADRRRYYQQVCQNLVASLQASLSGKKQRTSTTSGITPTTRSTRLAYQKQLQQLNSCMSSSSSMASSQDGAATASSIRNATLTASAKLHEACSQFCLEIQRGSLATIKQIVEGAHVVVTAPSSSSSNRSPSSSGGVVRQVRGEVVHLDESFACVDYIDPSDAQSDILFENTRSTMINNATVEDVIEENDVWSDGNHVYIARRDGVCDTLKQIPLDRIRTHPGWLKDKIESSRTDDLGCFLNADIFQSIVADFIEEDWRPRCLDLLDRMREILQVTVKHVVQETTGGGGNNSSGSHRPGGSRTRYPGLQRHLVQQCRNVAEDIIKQAYFSVESHLALEKHPCTQDHSLFQNIAQARHANLKRDLEVALRLDQEPPASSMKLSNKAASTMTTSRDAIQNVIDEVFERHSKKSAEDHMAEEMEIVLEAYGSIATRRVMDRTPMICWQVFRSITAAIQDALYCNVTDEILENQILRQAPDFEKRYSQLTEELKEWNHALEIVESVM